MCFRAYAAETWQARSQLEGGFFLMSGSLLSSDKQAHIPMYLVKSLTVLRMHVQAQCCFYKI